MEILDSKDHVLIKDGNWILQCSKDGQQFLARDERECAELLSSSRCIGRIHAVVGRLQPQITGNCHCLLVVSKWTKVAQYPVNKVPIYRIDRATAIPLSASVDLNRLRKLLLPCEEHYTDAANNPSTSSKVQNFLVGKDVGTSLLSSTAIRAPFKLLGENKKQQTDEGFKNYLSQNGCQQINVNGSASDQINSPAMLEEILRLFNDECPFYICLGCDLTLSMQRQLAGESTDIRFFWNKQLLDGLETSEANANGPLVQRWKVPVIQGYVDEQHVTSHTGPPIIVSLISRRSTSRAGVRYVKRGIDETGSVANYVETEQILRFFDHHLSFVQLRGSVPVFWSQRGYRYRPPLQIDRCMSESMPAFQSHFIEQLAVYGEPIVCVNLVEQAGRESKLSEAFMEHAITFDSDKLVFVTYDFHQQCRGMRFDRVSILVEALTELAERVGYCWADKTGIAVLHQSGTFRVNCVDCLDRTNVVQTAFALLVLKSQLAKLGFVDLQPNDEMAGLPVNLVTAVQHMWADNGDAVSRQYAGTAALKGDVTRRGQRGFGGMMRDGYNSASRYYLCHMRDAARQRAIDALLGQLPERMDDVSAEFSKGLSEDSRKAVESEEMAEVEAMHDNLRRLVQECQRFMIPENETQVGGWALIDADPGTGGNDFDQVDMDCVVLLTRSALYVVPYDDETDKFEKCQRVSLSNIARLDVGPMSRGGVNLLAAARQKRVCLRIYYRSPDLDPTASSVGTSSGNLPHHFTFRPAATRLFNNMAIPLKSRADADEYIQAIGQQFQVALEVSDSTVRLNQVEKMERVRTAQRDSSPISAGKRLATLLVGAVKGRPTKAQADQQTTTVTVQSTEDTAGPTNGSELDGRMGDTDQSPTASVNSLHIPNSFGMKMSQSEGAIAVVPPQESATNPPSPGLGRRLKQRAGVTVSSLADKVTHSLGSSAQRLTSFKSYVADTDSNDKGVSQQQSTLLDHWKEKIAASKTTFLLL